MVPRSWVYCTWHLQHTMELDIGWESWFLPTPPAFNARVRGSPSEYCHDVWYGKTRMVWLLYSEQNFADMSFVLSKRIETDRHHMTTCHNCVASTTDRQQRLLWELLTYKGWTVILSIMWQWSSCIFSLHLDVFLISSFLLCSVF